MDWLGGPKRADSQPHPSNFRDQTPPHSKRHQQRISDFSFALGLPPARVSRLLSSYPPLARYNPRTLSSKMEVLGELLGWSQEEVVEAVGQRPQLIGSMSVAKMEER